MRRVTFLFLILIASAACAEKMTAPQLIESAKSHRAGLAEAIAASFDAKQLESGTAWSSQGPEFFFAVESASAPALVIDDAPGPAMQKAEGSGLWYAAARIDRLGRLHSFHYVVDGAPFGGSRDVPAYGPLSYRKAGVPSGTVSAKITHTSRIYDGMKSDYWIYVPAGYDSQTPAALMVFQDGGGYLQAEGDASVPAAIDNLIAEKKIPPMICVFVNPGDIGGAPGTPTWSFVKGYSDKWSRDLRDSMRSTLYDTVSDRYARFLRDEILAEVGGKYNLRKDAYSRAITGASSGGICAFNAAWQMPDQFSRVITWIGSFVAIQWKEDPAVVDGGQDYPEKVLREPKRNIRVWLQDGAHDMEDNFFGSRYGSWALSNVRMANALKNKGYDFHFSFSQGSHNGSHGRAEFPQEMIWLWRDYDPARTEQAYVMEPAEKAKPAFRVSIANRDHDDGN
jgi:enterochelin esterase-like enzyme